MFEKKIEENLFQLLVQIADDKLILGHRLSEWCGHAPILEEDIALANIALDNIGQANSLYQIAVKLENKNRSEDELAFFRDEREFRNIQIVELPKGDFAFTIVRQFLYDNFSFLLFQKFCDPNFIELSDVSKKIVKEISYNLRHSKEWILRLGIGTEESKFNTQKAIDKIWEFTNEMFEFGNVENFLIEKNIIPNLDTIKTDWELSVKKIFDNTNLQIPNISYFASGGRNGFHTEYLGYLLAEMQIVARSNPNVKW